MQRLFAAIRAFGESEGPTLGAVRELYGTSALVPQLTGTATQIADRLEALFVGGACDGLTISPSRVPGAFAVFVADVVPELQRRQLFRSAYTGATLREHLGLQATATA